jgi:hypothetical protein
MGAIVGIVVFVAFIALLVWWDEGNENMPRGNKKTVEEWATEAREQIVRRERSEQAARRENAARAQRKREAASGYTEHENDQQ